MVDWEWKLRKVRLWTSTSYGLERIEYPSEDEADFSLKLRENGMAGGWTSLAPDWLPEGSWQHPLWENYNLQRRRSWACVCLGGEGWGLSPTREGPGKVPAICLALLGLVLLPTDRELVRGAHKQRQLSNLSPRALAVYMLQKKWNIFSGSEKEGWWRRRERETKRIREEKNIRQREEKC